MYEHPKNRDSDAEEELQKRSESVGTHYAANDAVIVSWEALSALQATPSPEHVEREGVACVGLREESVETDAPEPTEPIKSVESPQSEVFPAILDRFDQSGRRIVYKRVDPPLTCESLLDWILLERERVGMSVLIASNLIIFALGYIMAPRD